MINVDPLATKQISGDKVFIPDTNASTAQKAGRYLQASNVVEILACFLDTLNHGLFALTDPDTRIIDLLVGLVGTLGVANLGLEIALLLLVKVLDTNPVGPLGVCINADKETRSVGE
jgi:hypothetical protein